MTHNQPFEDIVPPDKRTIRNITNQHSYARKPPLNGGMGAYNDGYENKRSPKSSRIGLWFAAGIAVIIFALAFSLLFSGAKVEIVPKQRTVLLNGAFEAGNSLQFEGLTYNVMTIEKTGSKIIAAEGQERVETKASGDIIIYNSFNSSSQRLIKNTRFETPEGLIYKINESAVVPGQTTSKGETIPGSVRVTVYADDFGEKYNIGLTDFTIPGFKGSPRFEGFYARSAAPMTGGFIGEKLVASADKLANAENEIKENLKQQLLNEAFSQKPQDSILYEDAVFLEFEPMEDNDIGDTVEVAEKAVLYGVLFKENEFANYIAENSIADFDDGSVEITNVLDLDFAILDKENTKPWEEDSISFTLSGNAAIVWLFDEASLKQDLSGRSKDALSTVLSGYQSIERAEVILRPFWKSSFPDEVQKIKIERMLK